MPILPDAVMRFQRNLPKTVVVPYLLRYLGVVFPVDIQVTVRLRAPKEDDVTVLSYRSGRSPHGKSPNGKTH